MPLDKDMVEFIQREITVLNESINKVADDVEALGQKLEGMRGFQRGEKEACEVRHECLDAHKKAITELQIFRNAEEGARRGFFKGMNLGLILLIILLSLLSGASGATISANVLKAVNTVAGGK